MKMRIGKFFQLALLILLAAGAQPAYSAFYQWSKTSSSNATADPSINWAEGMSPSSVNDSARAMMARAAEYRDDISGLLTTFGSSTVYGVTTNQGLNATPNDGQLLAITMSATNGSNPTLVADGGTAFPIQSAPGVAVPAATLILGSPYTMKFSVANSAWMLRDFYGSALTVPLGGMIAYTLGTVPNSNFVFAAGQCLSTTTYATYWAAAGSPGSGSCPGGQFRIIDMSGRVPAGLDTVPGFAAANRLTSSATGCGTVMTIIGVACANGIEGSVISLAQLPTGITSVNGSQPIVVNSDNLLIDATGILQDFNPVTASGFRAPNNTASLRQQLSRANNSISVTSNNTSGVARPNVPPIVGVIYIVRVI
jgi:hypothetical protein